MISLQAKMEVLILWRLFWGGVLWDTLEIVANRIMSLAAIELLFKMQEQSRYPDINEIQKEVKDTVISDIMQRMYHFIGFHQTKN